MSRKPKREDKKKKSIIFLKAAHLNSSCVLNSHIHTYPEFHHNKMNNIWLFICCCWMSTIIPTTKLLLIVQSYWAILVYSKLPSVRRLQHQSRFQKLAQLVSLVASFSVRHSAIYREKANGCFYIVRQ